MNKFLLLFILFSLSVYSQEWKKIGKSEILYSNFYSNKTVDTDSLKYEYFTKGKIVIAVDKFSGDPVFRLFSYNPEAFDDIVNVSLCKFRKNELIVDNLIENLNFTEIIAFSGRDVVEGQKEVIWVMFCKEKGDELKLSTSIVFKKKRKNRMKYIKTI
jgi:hypothetical protein